MPTFRYTARTRSGQTMSGELEAVSNSNAVAQLRDMGLWVTDLRPVGGGRQPRSQRSFAGEYVYPIHSGVNEKDRSLFYSQLHATLVAGMPFYQALVSLGEQTPNPRLRGAIREMAQHILDGGRMSEVMQRYPWLFSRLELRMIEAAELGGLMEECLRRLAAYLEREYNLRLQIKQRTLYPKLVLLTFIFVPSLVTWVMQGFVAYIADIATFWAPIFIGLLFLVIGYRYLMKYPSFRDFRDQVNLALPVIGPLVRKLAVARFARGMAALYHAGVSPVTSLVAAAEASGNVVLEKSVRRMAPAIERGSSLTQAMVMTGFFPPMFTGMIATGEQTGSLDETLDKSAEYYESEATHASIQLVVILGVVLLLIMAVVVALKVIGFYMTHYGAATGAVGGGD
jgi:type IV pilus assembly protein PilC